MFNHRNGLERAALCVSVGVFACGVSAENWPSFRGPNASGLGTGSPPVKWNVETGENIKWKTFIPGLAHSSPIVWGDRVYVTTAVNAAGDASLAKGWLQGTGDSAKDEGEWEWKVIALDKQTGKVVWDEAAHKGAPKFKRHIKATHANSTPCTDGKHVVAFFGSEGLYCYDTAGKLLWKKDFGALNAAPGDDKSLEWGFANSPIIHDGKVIVQCDAVESAFLAVLDVQDGRELWRTKREDDTTWSSPSVHVGKDRTTIVCNGYKEMAGYDLSTGKRLWQLHGGGDVPVPAPVVAGDSIFITNGHGRKPIYVIRADSSGDLTPNDDTKPDALLWWSKVKGSYMPTPIVVGDIFYVSDDGGIFTGFEAATGKQLLRERLPGGGNSTYSASPVSADGRVYAVNEDGQVDVVKTGREYEHLATNQMGEVCMASPAISDGLLFIRGQKTLFCIGK